MGEKAKGELIFVKSQPWRAAYLDGRLICYGEMRDPRYSCGSLLKALGYSCRDGGTIPERGRLDDLPEFDWHAEHAGRWEPPKTLAKLRGQQAAYQERQRQEHVRRYREELARLEKEDAP
jgi:hypothetical protein